MCHVASGWARPWSAKKLWKLRKEQRMSGIRILVGTRKGAFVLTSGAKRDRWDIKGISR